MPFPPEEGPSMTFLRLEGPEEVDAVFGRRAVMQASDAKIHRFAASSLRTRIMNRKARRLDRAEEERALSELLGGVS